MSSEQPRASTLTDADLLMVRAVIEEVTKHQPPGLCENCVCEIDIERHKKHHQFMDELISVLKKWNEVKWFSLKSTISVLVIGLVCFALFYLFNIKLDPYK